MTEQTSRRNSQTLVHMESEYVYPTLMNRTQTDQWEKEGSQDLFSRSRETVDEILSAHYPNFFGDSIDTKTRQEFPIHLPKSQMVEVITTHFSTSIRLKNLTVSSISCACWRLVPPVVTPCPPHSLCISDMIVE